MPDFLPVCQQAARAGGKVLLDWVGKIAAREKAPSDLVTEADFASQTEIRKILLDAFPDHAFLGEEGNPAGSADSEYRWLVDPLDGTTNYVHQIPHYCVSIALERRGQVLCGAVFDPVADECFTAALGWGAYLNGRRIHASKADKLSQSVVVVSFPPRVTADAPELQEFLRVIVACRAIRRTGAAALNLAYVAAGRFDGYWGSQLKPWDVAAGGLLVQEAGAMITTGDGRDFRFDQPKFIAAATPSLHAQLSQLVRDPASPTA